jgi:hypothetical protein
LKHGRPYISSPLNVFSTYTSDAAAQQNPQHDKSRGEILCISMRFVSHSHSRSASATPLTAIFPKNRSTYSAYVDASTLDGVIKGMYAREDMEYRAADSTMIFTMNLASDIRPDVDSGDIFELSTIFIEIMRVHRMVVTTESATFVMLSAGIIRLEDNCKTMTSSMKTVMPVAVKMLHSLRTE